MFQIFFNAFSLKALIHALLKTIEMDIIILDGDVPKLKQLF